MKKPRSAEDGRNREFTALHTLSVALSRSQDPDEILAKGLEVVLQLLDLPAGGICEAIWSEGRLRLRIGQGISPTVSAAVQDLPMEGTYTGQAARDCRTIVVRDLLKAPPHLSSLRETAQREGYGGLACVPILVNEHVWGVLTVLGKEPRSFSPEQIQLLEGVSRQLGVALERALLVSELAGTNARLRGLLEGAEAHRHRLETLTRVARSVTTTLDPQEVFQAIVRAVVDLFPGTACRLWLVEGESVVLRTEAGVQGLAGRTTSFPFGEGLVGTIAATRQPLVIADVRQDPRVVNREWMDKEGFVSYLGLPLLVDGQVEGVLVLFTRTPHQFLSDEVALLDSLASQVAVAIKNARLFDEAQRRARELSTLHEIGTALVSTLDVSSILDAIAGSAVTLIGAHRAAVFELDPRDQCLHVRATRGMRPDQPFMPIKVGQGAAGSAVLRCQPVFSPDVEAQPLPMYDELWGETGLTLREVVRRRGYRAILAVPLISKEAVLGALCIYWDEAHPYDEREVRLLTAMARQAALALENARLLNESRKHAGRVQVLVRLNQAMSASLRPNQVLGTVRQAAVQLFNAFRVAVWIADEERRLLTLWMPLAGDPGNAVQPQRHFGEDGVGWVAQHGEPLLFASIQTDHRLSPQDRARNQGFSSFTAIPIQLQGKLLGVLCFTTTTPHEAHAEDRALLDSLAGQAAIALENARLYEEAQKRAQELQGLIRAGRTVSSSLEQGEVLQAIVREAAIVMGVQTCSLSLLDPGGEGFKWVAGVGVPSEWRELPPFQPGEGLPGWVVAEGRPLALRDGLTDSRVRRPELWRRYGFVSYLGVPVKEGERPIGVLSFLTREPRHFGEDEIALALSFADQAVIAIKNVRLFEAAVRRSRELSALYAVVSAAGQSLKLNEILERALERAIEVFEFEAGRIFLVEGEEVVLATCRGLQEEVIREVAHRRIGEGLVGRSIRDAKPICFEDMASNPGYLRLARQQVSLRIGFRAQIVVPILLSGKPIGALSLLHRTPHRFTLEEVQLLSAIAQQLAVAINNARLFQETQRAYEELAATQDELVQVEKLRAMGEMASGVAHDFNNVLAAILSRAQLLFQRAEDPELRRELRIIEQAALDGAQTVRRVQEFARVRREQSFIAVDVVQVVHDAIEVTQPRWRDELESKGIQVRVEAEFTPVPPVAGNPAELREVLTNMILNALDAMPAGGTLTLKTWATDQGAVIELKDTGVGMPDEIRRRIFDPFFTTKGPKGTGLGLAVAYGIVTRHGGDIQVESQEGVGSTFTVRLPYGRLDALPMAPKEPAPMAGARILVIDDEEAVREALRDILSLRHLVEEVASGMEGVERLRETEFDVVFTDLGMAGMSGWQVAQAAKAIRPGTPVVLVTGWGVQLDPAELQAQGVRRVLSKPFSMAEVLELVSSLVNVKSVEGAGE